MPWFKVDDGLHSHPKAMRAGTPALGLWARCGSWASDQLTDGFVPSEIALMYGTRAMVRALVTAGLWTEVSGGYQFHDWKDKNPSRTDVLAERAAATERQRKAREAAKAKRDAARTAAELQEQSQETSHRDSGVTSAGVTTPRAESGAESGAIPGVLPGAQREHNGSTTDERDQAWLREQLKSSAAAPSTELDEGDGSSRRSQRRRSPLSRRDSAVTSAEVRSPRPDPTRPEGSYEPSTNPPQPSAVPPNAKRGTRFPDQWHPDPDLRTWAAQKCPAADVDLETEQWADHHRAKGDTAKDWTASWRTWMRNAQKWAPQRRPQPTGPADGLADNTRGHLALVAHLEAEQQRKEIS